MSENLELQRGIITAHDISLELTPGERVLLDQMRIQLTKDSVNLAMRKCKISQQMHTALLKKPEYKALIDGYKKKK